MRGKIGIWIILGLLFLRPAAMVHAAPSDSSVAEAVSGYCVGDELHAFIRLKEGYDVSKFRVSLQSAGASADREGVVAQLTETDAIVRYVFMVDQSGSMRKYAEEVNIFVDSLMESEKRKAFFTVATFGEQFQVVKEDLTDRNTVQTELGALRYKEKLTDPYTGVESALTYLDGYSIKSGDLIHLVVITDGDPDLGIEDEAKSMEREKELAQALTERITDTPEIIVSTFCTGDWTENTYQAFSVGRGIHENIGDDQTAADAGARMAEYVDSLYRVSFSLSEEPETERFDVELTIKERGAEGIILSLESVPNLKLFSDAAPEGPEENGISVIGGHLREPDKSNKDQTGLGEPEDREDSAGMGKRCLNLLLPTAAGALVLVGICVLLLVRKRKAVRAGKRPDSKPGQAKGAGAGIAMKLVVYSGKCKRQSTMFYLAEPIVIGRAPGCDVVFADPEVSPRNSRIFIRNQMICIEDLNSAAGTALGGMRIQGQNRLRSGDVISIGNVEFCFKF